MRNAKIVGLSKANNSANSSDFVLGMFPQPVDNYAPAECIRPTRSRSTDMARASIV
jgi:hypothetical protein